MLNRPEVADIANELSVSPAQIMIRWSIQKGFVPIPKTVQQERMAKNIDVYNFELSEKLMDRLDRLEINFVTAWDPSEDSPV